MKFFQIYLYLFLTLFIACKSNTKKITAAEIAKDDIASIINDTISITSNNNELTTRKEINLSYWDIYDNKIIYSNDIIKPIEYNIITKSPIILRDDDILGQVNYVLMPGDHIKVSSSFTETSLKLKVSTDVIRNNELDFFNALKSARVTFVSYQLLKNLKLKGLQNVELKEYIIYYRSKDYDFAQKYTEAKYKDELKFLNEYVRSKKISKKMIEIFNDIIYFDYVASKLKLDLALLKQNTITSSAIDNDVKLLKKKNNTHNYLYLKTFKQAQVSYLEILKTLHMQTSLMELINQNFKGEIKNYLLFYTVKKAIAERTHTTTMLDHFNKYCSNEDFKTEINKNIELILPEKETNLIARDGHSISYKDLINQNKGKVIYIDFWASWCAPCIQQMPYSFKLHQDFVNYPISFMYFSIDESNSSWKTKTDALKIDAKNSFLIINGNKSSLAKNFNIKTIPRIIIIDKTGKVASVNGNLPTQPTTKAYLLKLLKH